LIIQNIQKTELEVIENSPFFKDGTLTVDSFFITESFDEIYEEIENVLAKCLELFDYFPLLSINIASHKHKETTPCTFREVTVFQDVTTSILLEFFKGWPYKKLQLNFIQKN